MTQSPAPPGRPSCLGIESVLTLLVTLAKRSCRRRRGASSRRTRGGSHSVRRAALIAVVPGHRSTMTMSSLGSSPSDGIVRGSPIAPGVTPVDTALYECVVDDVCSNRVVDYSERHEGVRSPRSRRSRGLCRLPMSPSRRFLMTSNARSGSTSTPVGSSAKSTAALASRAFSSNRIAVVRLIGAVVLELASELSAECGGGDPRLICHSH